MEAKKSILKSTARLSSLSVIAAAQGRESPFEDTASSAGSNQCAVAEYGDQEHRQDLPLGSEDTLARDFLRFKTSAALQRVLFFASGVWKDLPPPVVKLVKVGFLAGKALMDVTLGDSTLLFDFLRMMLIDAATNCRSSIAWIDVKGRCFFPGVFIESTIVNQHILAMAMGAGEGRGAAALSGEGSEMKSLPQAKLEGHSSEDCRVVLVASSLERQGWRGVQQLDKEKNVYKWVESIFLTSMRKFAPSTTVTSISRCSHVGLSASGRSKAFAAQMEVTMSARGDARVKAGWYGASASDIISIIDHGFRKPNNRSLNPQTQAVGVYLAALNCPHACSSLAEADDGGEKHVILCGVITGNLEKVDIYRPQWHPSTGDFDCGVDDLEQPNWYIVWTTLMNTHVLPEFIISFRTLVSGQAVAEAPSGPLTTIPIVALPEMIAELRNHLPSSTVQTLQILYAQLKTGLISKAVFPTKFREIAGEKLLGSLMMKYCKGQ